MKSPAWFFILHDGLEPGETFEPATSATGEIRAIVETMRQHPELADTEGADSLYRIDLAEIEEALTQGRIRPEQAGFWLLLRARSVPLTPAQTERYGVEFITTPERLRAVRRCYPCPTAVDVGYGVFGNKSGLLFVDDKDGRAVAYALPLPPAGYHRERRHRGLCPICGERIRLAGDTTDGRYVGACGDAFTPSQWRALGPRRTKVSTVGRTR